MKVAVILDFDGTIVESVDIKTDAFREMFKDHPKVPEIMAYHRANNGVSRFIKLRHIYEHFLGRVFDDATQAEAGQNFSRIVFEKVVACPFVPGAEDFLQEFSGDRRLFLVSATPHVELQGIVEARGLTQRFAGIYGTPPGSKIAHIQAILAQCNLSPRQAVYIGDSREDMRAAREGGVDFIARRNKEDFGDYRPQFDDMAQIARYLRREHGNVQPNAV